MHELKIELIEDRGTFEPSDTLEGTAVWNFEQAPSSIELRLFWFTRGKGTEDAGVIETVRFEHPLASDKQRFGLSLPDAPYSFSGKLISLIWALELIAEP